MIGSHPWHEQPSDETLVIVSEYLSHIVDGFQARHRHRIRRYYRTSQTSESRPGACHERQLHLFGEPCPPF